MAAHLDTMTAARPATPAVVSVLFCLLSLTVGHMAKDCTQGQKCYNCGRLGHVSRDCDQAAQAKVCYRLGTRSIVSDYRCQQPGHISRDCTNEPVASS